MFEGFVELAQTLMLLFRTKVGGTPQDADALPTYRVYGPDGLMSEGTGSAALKDSGPVTGGTNATPIVITSAAHGLTTGTLVRVSGVTGLTLANGTFPVTVLGPDTFSLDGSAGNAAYTGGGLWHAAGLYGISLEAAASDGYEKGVTYTVVVDYQIEALAYGLEFTFTVV